MAADDRLQLVDSHMHMWHLSANRWYPLLQPEPSPESEEHDFGIGEMGGLQRNYLLDDYRSDSAAYDVRKLVHVSAVSAPRTYLQEAGWLDRMAADTGFPTAVVGAVEPTLSAAEMEADLKAQADSPLFRGARVLTGLDPTSDAARELLRLLSAGDWVFDMVAHPGEMADFCRLVASFPDLRVVLEHSGWPDSGDPEHFSAWREAMSGVAALDNVTCKVSGLPMTLHTISADAMGPWIEACFELFGVDRCMFGSNFPVDSLFGTYDDLITAYRAVTDGLSAGERARFFTENAERVYRL